MTGATKTGQERKRDGQYGSNFKAVCECGHTLGQHTAERPYECLECEAGDGPCCDGFRRAKGGK